MREGGQIRNLNRCSALVLALSSVALVLCNTAQGKMSSPVFSGALQNRLTACTMSLCYTYADLLFIQVCSEPAPMRYSIAQGRMSSPVSSGTGSQLALCHCIYNYAVLLFIQVPKEPAPMQCTTGFGKMSSSVFSAALQNRLTTCRTSLYLHPCRFALHQGAQRTSTNAVQHCSGQDELPSVQWCSAN